MTMGPPQCWIRQCKHYQGIKELGDDPENPELGQQYTCKAFPKGIPEDISLGNNKHMKVHPEQKNQIIYEKKKGV